MSKNELIKVIARRYPQFSISLVEAAVNLFFQMIAFYLQHRQRVELRGFGSFCVRKRSKRTARNPQTGQIILVEEKWVPFFRAGNSLRSALKKVKAGQKKSGIFSIIYRDFTRAR